MVYSMTIEWIDHFFCLMDDSNFEEIYRKQVLVDLKTTFLIR